VIDFKSILAAVCSTVKVALLLQAA
jgi:hypothetical protein